MFENILMILWLFILFSFFGWLFETIVSTILNKKFVNRGILNGPFSLMYGFAGTTMLLFFQELSGIWLFIGCFLIGSVVEWITKNSNEKIHKEPLWKYSKTKWNLDGEISLINSFLWGITGFIYVDFLDEIFLSIYTGILYPFSKYFVIILSIIILIDIIATYAVVFGGDKKLEKWKIVDGKMESFYKRNYNRFYLFTNRRLKKSYPNKFESKKNTKSKKNSRVYTVSNNIFEGCSFYKLVMLFFIGAFLGDITETIFCRITAGVWMSRSSVVWGDFSIVWGLAMALATLFLYKHRHRSDTFIFLFGTFLGGAYEYVCSVFTELVFGVVFWDYSDIPFNLGGRINLLYCFFWGIAAVVWLRIIYPPFSNLIEKIPSKMGKPLTWILMIFMTVNMFVSASALVRFNQRKINVESEPSNFFEEWIDTNFDDEKVMDVYPNLIMTE